MSMTTNQALEVMLEPLVQLSQHPLLVELIERADNTGKIRFAFISDDSLDYTDFSDIGSAQAYSWRWPDLMVACDYEKPDHFVIKINWEMAVKRRGAFSLEASIGSMLVYLFDLISESAELTMALDHPSSNPRIGAGPSIVHAYSLERGKPASQVLTDRIWPYGNGLWTLTGDEEWALLTEKASLLEDAKRVSEANADPLLSAYNIFYGGAAKGFDLKRDYLRLKAFARADLVRAMVLAVSPGSLVQEQGFNYKPVMDAVSFQDLLATIENEPWPFAHIVLDKKLFAFWKQHADAFRAPLRHITKPNNLAFLPQGHNDSGHPCDRN